MNRTWLSLVLLIFLLSGCAPAMSSAPAIASDQKSTVSNEAVPAAPMAVAPMGADSANSVPYAGGGNASSVDQLIIQNANLSIAVADPAKSMDDIVKMTEEMKGYVVDSNIYKTHNENGLELPEAHLTIRVPADRLTEALDFIKSLTPDVNTDVLSETRSGQNVTKEYTDQKSRLKNLEDAEAQLREIMASATRTEDVMSVFNQLTQVREQIEITKGQIKYYEESAAMSAVDVTVRSKSGIAPLSIGGWQPAGVARDAIQSLINALKFFGNAAIWIVLFLLPVLIILMIPVWIAFVIIRAIVRRNKAKKLSAAPVDETKKTS
jgi:TolA-binding protein